MGSGLDTQGLNVDIAFVYKSEYSSDQQQINQTIENKCAWSTDFLLCWVTKYLPSQHSQASSQVTMFLFAVRALK